MNTNITEFLALCFELFCKGGNHSGLAERTSFCAGHIILVTVLCTQSNLNDFVVGACCTWPAGE